MSSIASSSKGSLPFNRKNTDYYDSVISNQPHYSSASSSSSSSSTFRTTTVAYDPELFLGDDCDSSYEATLMQSGLLDWLQNDMDGFPKTSSTKDIFRCCATPRLEMILNHMTHGNHPSYTSMASKTNKKDKEKTTR